MTAPTRFNEWGSIVGAYAVDLEAEREDNGFRMHSITYRLRIVLAERDDHVFPGARFAAAALLSTLDSLQHTDPDGVVRAVRAFAEMLHQAGLPVDELRVWGSK